MSSLVINYNSSAQSALLNLTNTNNELDNSIEQLSSGLKINTAADDPAGYVVATQMGNQASGMGQAITNANNGINVAKTAEGALNETNNLLGQMRTLALDAANAGANSTQEVAADQSALNDAVASISRIASTTQFNGKNLLDGTYSNQTFQIGANATDTVSLSIGAMDATSLGVGSLNLSSNPSAAITAIDAAISTVSSQAASLGSFQTNTLQTTVNSLSTAQQNIQSSQSDIMDTNIAQEMSNFSQYNIMVQAGNAMLAQANQAPQDVLKLLQ